MYDIVEATKPDLIHEEDGYQTAYYLISGKLMVGLYCPVDLNFLLKNLFLNNICAYNLFLKINF